MSEKVSLEDCVDEFLLCSRYGELLEMRSLVDALKQYCLEAREEDQEFRIEEHVANRRDVNGNSALHMAAANGHEGSAFKIGSSHLISRRGLSVFAQGLECRRGLREHSGKYPTALGRC
jgi:hypothetical protein